VSFIKTLNIVQHSHHDIGYTDLPAITGVIHQRNFAEAFRMMQQYRHSGGERFCWTAEIALPVSAWYKNASESDRKTLHELAGEGIFDLGAMAVHQNGFMNETEWQWALDSIADGLDDIPRKTLIQIDVNGIPLGGLVLASERGVKQLWMSPNSYMGFPIKPAYQAFFWRLPNGRKILVWQNDGYNNFERLLTPVEWRRGPIPAYHDLQFRPPDARDLYSADDTSIRKMHQFLLTQLPDVERQCGAEYPEIPVSCTNSYRLDNDPPAPGLPEMVRRWNELGLEPQLKLTTFSQAIERVGNCGKELPEYSGSWPDWWANGVPSMPRQHSASRSAKRICFQLGTPLFEGASQEKLYRKALHDLVIFDEHCYCSWSSASRPWSVLTEGATAEKTAYAYRALAEFELLRSDKLRPLLQWRDNTVVLINPTTAPISEYVTIRTEALRGNYTAVRDESSGRIIPLIDAPGDKFFVPADDPAHFSCWNSSAVHKDLAPGANKLLWGSDVRPGEMRRYTLLQTADRAETSVASNWEMDFSAGNWPVNLCYKPTKERFLREDAGAFSSLTIAGDFKRTTFKAMFDGAAAQMLHQQAEYGQCICEELPHMLIFRQRFSHPLLRHGERKMEVWKNSPRIRISCKIDRKEDFSPVVYAVKLPMGCAPELPRISAAGEFFTPFEEQIPGACRDYFVCDDVILFRSGDLALGNVDTALCSFGAPRLLDNLNEPPANVNDVYSIVYHNFWDTNFAGNQYGVMEFRYDLFALDGRSDQEALAAARSLASGLLPAVQCREQITSGE